jgi:hypothetical protein
MLATRQTKFDTNATWINVCILVGSVMFIIVLAVSALFLPQWRVLHFLQALPYVAVILLTRRRITWGFGAGALTALFWNILVLFRSPVGPQAIQAVESLFLSGQALRPDVLLQLFGAVGHVLMIVACLAGFLGLRPAAREWGQFVAGGALAIGYVLAMAFTVGPPEAAEHIRRALGL